VKRVALLACAAAITACNGETAAPSLVAATVTRRSDTVQFEVPLVTYRCDSTADLLLEGIRAGYGVMVWLRLGDSLAGELPIVGVLDSGSVSVNDSGSARSIAVTGSGMEVAFGARSGVAASIASLPAPDSTLSCAPAR
jgi:hypothetical protein